MQLFGVMAHDTILLSATFAQQHIVYCAEQCFGVGLLHTYMKTGLHGCSCIEIMLSAYFAKQHCKLRFGEMAERNLNTIHM